MKLMYSYIDYKYIKSNLENFTLYSLLEFLEFNGKQEIELIDNLFFVSSLYLAQPINEIHSIIKEKNNMIIVLNNVSLLNYLPQIYTELAIKSQGHENLKQLFNIFTQNIVYLNYKIKKINYLPLYTEKKRLSIYKNFFRLINGRLLLSNHHTIYSIKELIHKSFKHEIELEIKKNMPRKIIIPPSNMVLGKNWLGLSTQVYDLLSIFINCLTTDSYLRLKSGELEYIKNIFHCKMEIKISLNPTLMKNVNLGSSVLGVGIKL